MDEIDEIGSRWQQLKNFSKKFKLDSHHTIERFGVVLGASMLSGAVLLSGGMYASHQSGKADLSQISTYNAEFTSSRTHQQGTVSNVYTNADKTRAFVLMKFTNPDQMSLNAEDYYVYGMGMKEGPSSKPTTMDQPTVGSLYSFGSSGYLGVLLEAPEGFGEQVVNLTVRARKELAEARVSPGAEPADEGSQGESFKQYDQWRVVVNPGAEGAVKTDVLDVPGGSGEGLDIRRVYTQLINVDAERELRYEMNESLSNLKMQLDRVRAVEDSMANTPVTIGSDRNVRMLPPVLPDTLVGDEVEGMSEAQVREALNNKPVDDIPGIAEKTDTARALDVFNDGTVPNTYVLNSRTPVEAGLNFDWRSKSIYDGYLDEVVPGGKTPDVFMRDLVNTEVKRFSARDLVWPLSNGQLLGDRDMNDVETRALGDLRNRALQAYQGYYDAKFEYERTHMWAMLNMDRAVTTAVDSATVATGNTAVEFRN